MITLLPDSVTQNERRSSFSSIISNVNNAVPTERLETRFPYDDQDFREKYTPGHVSPSSLKYTGDESKGPRAANASLKNNHPVFIFSRPSASLLAFLAGRVWTRHGFSTIAFPAFLYCWALPAGRAIRDASHPTPRLADTAADAPPPTDANDHGPPANQFAAAAVTTPVASDVAPRRHRRRVCAGLFNPRSIDTTANSSDTVHRPYLMGHTRWPFAT